MQPGRRTHTPSTHAHTHPNRQYRRSLGTPAPRTRPPSPRCPARPAPPGSGAPRGNPARSPPRPASRAAARFVFQRRGARGKRPGRGRSPKARARRRAWRGRRAVFVLLVVVVLVVGRGGPVGVLESIDSMLYHTNTRIHITMHAPTYVHLDRRGEPPQRVHVRRPAVVPTGLALGGQLFGQEGRLAQVDLRRPILHPLGRLACVGIDW